MTAPEAGDEANAILILLLSRRLRVNAERITIVSGGQSRVKQVRIETLGQAVVDARLRGLDAGARRRSRRRATAAAGVAAAGLAAAVIVIASGSGASVSHGPPTRRPRMSVAAAHGTARRVRAAPGRRRQAFAADPAPGPGRPRVRTRPRPDPGRLPQTALLPSARTHEFVARMRGLWAAIAGASVRAARAAFFPEAAYVQLKSVGDPAGDFKYRLYNDYRLDIAAAHTLLGPDAGSSRLLGVTAVAGYAHWVAPGICDNTVGYFELPNARLVYRENGQLRSIGIASLISWRGVWYVVHLGAILRGSAGGVVDAPSAGPGVSVPAGTC